jgi:hypothetical protein
MNLLWTKTAPTVEALRGAPSPTYYWMRGGNYHVAFVVQVGVSSKLNPDRTVTNRVWFNLPTYAEHSTSDDLGTAFLGQFEWAGPILPPE